MKNPCVKECPKRSATCHGNCPDYAAFAAWCEEQREKRRLEQEGRMAERTGSGRIKRKIQRYEKYRGKRY